MNNGLVIIETRPIHNIREIVENHIHYTGWPVTFFHGFSNGEFVKDKLKGLDISFEEIRVTDLKEQGYNNFMASPYFWKYCPYDKVLIFQHDSILLRTGIDDFLEYDFVGSPWKFQKWGGNGGLSLRTKSVMLEIATEIAYNHILGNEDVYFCNIMHKNKKYKLAPRSVCDKFSCEAIFKLGTFGVHAIEKHLNKKQVEEIMNQYG